MDVPDTVPELPGITVVPFSQVMSLGMEFREKNPSVVEEQLEKGQKDDIATIIFTSK